MSFRVSEIDSLSDSGVKPNGRAIGKIEFNNVTFSYPTRSSLPVSFICDAKI